MFLLADRLPRRAATLFGFCLGWRAAAYPHRAPCCAPSGALAVPALPVAGVAPAAARLPPRIFRFRQIHFSFSGGGGIPNPRFHISRYAGGEDKFFFNFFFWGEMINMARMLGFLSGKQRVIFGGGESSLTLSRGAVSAAAERVAGLRRSAGNLSAKIPPKDVFRVWRRETGVCEFAAAMALDVLPVNQGGGNLFFKGGDVFRISVAAESGDCFVLRRNTAGGWDARWLHGRGADIFDFLRYCFSCDFSFAVKYLSLIRRALADAACGRARGKLWRREAAFSFMRVVRV